MRKTKHLKKLLTERSWVILAVFLLLGNSAVLANEQIKEGTLEPSEEEYRLLEEKMKNIPEEEIVYKLKISSKKEGFSKNQLKEVLEEKNEYIRSDIWGEIGIGEEKIFDSVSISNNDKIEELESEFKKQRTSLFGSLRETSKLSTDKNQSKTYSESLIKQSIEQNRQKEIVYSRIDILMDTEEELNNLEQALDEREYIERLEKVEEVISPKREEIKEVPAEKSVFDNIVSFLNPFQIIKANNHSWVPDFATIAFFDTDQTGFYLFDWWQDVDNATTYERPDAVSHWWRTYIVHRGTNGYPYFGKYNDEAATDFSGWQQMTYPYANTDRDHGLASHNDRLYHAVRGSSNQMFIRSSWDGGTTWTEFRSIGRSTSTSFDMVSHNGKLCITHKGNGSDKSIYVGCAQDGWWDWSGVTWYKAGSYLTNMSPAIASTFGTLWLGHTGTNNVPYLASSYNNGQTWNNISNFSNHTSNSPISLVGIGSSTWQNERLCAIRRGNNNEIYQKCLYRYGSNYNQWNWHPWLLQDGKTNDGPLLVSDSSRMAQIHRTLDNKIQSRTMEWASGRGYISHMRWDGDPGFENHNGYEHEVYLNNYDFTAPTPNYNEGKLYLGSSDSGNIPPVPPNACMPNDIWYHASNLPSYYIDTRLDMNGTCDSMGSGEISYTIGSEHAEHIQDGKYYFTYMNMAKGELYKPIFKVQSSLTDLQYWNPLSFGHGGTWAAFPVTTGVDLIVDSNSSIPGTPWYNMSAQGYNYPYWYAEN